MHNHWKTPNELFLNTMDKAMMVLWMLLMTLCISKYTCKALNKVQCPTECTCTTLPFEGLKTNCSGLPGPSVNEALKGISSETHYLYLEGTGLSEIPTDVFSAITNLRALYMRGNNFSTVELLIHNIPIKLKGTIRTLDFSQNGISVLQGDAFTNFTALQSLYLNGNQLMEFPSHTCLSSLITLELSGNKFKKIDQSYVQYLELLQHLNFSHNNIELIETKAFVNVPRLKELDLSYNEIGSHNEMVSLDGLFFLEALYLDGNRIQNLLEDIFRPLASLKVLSLSHNRITSLPLGMLDFLPHLVDLHVEYNKFQQIPTLSEKNSNLQHLYLGYNEITSVHKEDFHHFPKLNKLWLQHNLITTISDELLSVFNKIGHGSLQLNGNPMACDCRLIWFARWIKLFKSHDETHMPRCGSPDNLVNQLLTEVKLSDFKCDSRPIKCTKEACDRLRENVCVDSNKAVSCLCGNQYDCSVCPNGTYEHPTDWSGNRNSITCVPCPAFQTSDVGSSKISECSCMEGHARSDQEDCTACPQNTFKSTRGRGECRPCPTGSLTYIEGSSHCVCAAGYTLSGNGSCIECPPNTYKEDIGPDACVACPDHSSSPARSTNSAACQCTYGIFKAIPGNKYGTCQEYEHQEKIELGLIAPENHKAATSGNIIAKIAENNDIGMILGSVGTVVSLAVAAVVSLWCRHRQKRKFAAALKSSKSKFPSDLMPVHSMTPMYVANELYPKFEMPKSQLQVRQLIGQGAFGHVHEAMAYGICADEPEKPIRVAVKSFRENASQEEIDALRSELDQMIFVGKHPNVVSLLGACTKNDQLMIIMEYACFGNLQNYLKERSPGDEYFYLREKSCPKKEKDPRIVRNIMEDKTLMSIAWQIAKGMEHLANMKIIHRDLAARNVLLAEGMIAKVSDFGLAREVYENGYYFKNSKGRLPFKWMSPEALLCGQYTTKSDVWSYGILLWEIATFGGTPYSGVPVEQMYDMLKAGYRMRQPTNCPSKLYEIMLHCWHESPSDRPSFRELVNKFDKILQSAANKEYLDVQSNHYISESGYLTGFMTNSDDGIANDSNLEGTSYVSMATYPQYSCITKAKLSEKTKSNACHTSDKKWLCVNSRVDKTSDLPVETSFESRPLISKCTLDAHTVTATEKDTNSHDERRQSLALCSQPSVSSEGEVTIGESDIVEDFDSEVGESYQESAAELAL